MSVADIQVNFEKKCKLIFTNFCKTMNQELDHSLFLLHSIYVGHIAKLFDFVVTNLPESMLTCLLKPLWTFKEVK